MHFITQDRPFSGGLFRWHIHMKQSSAGKRQAKTEQKGLSSSRKRLAPQLIFKGGILNGWGRKMAVALNSGFYETLPVLEEVNQSEADLALLIYDLVLNPTQNRYVLTLQKTVYTNFEPTLIKITRSEAGEEALFLGQLQKELSKRLNNAAVPDAITPNSEF